MKKLLWLAGFLLVLLFGWGVYYTRPSQYPPPTSWGGKTSDSLNNYHPGATHNEVKADSGSKVAPMAAPHTRPLLAGERAQLSKQLNHQRVALNASALKLRRDSLRLKAHLALPLPATEQADYERMLAEQRQQAATYLRGRKVYRQRMEALKRGQRLL